MYQFFESTNITNYLKTSLTSYTHCLHYMYYFNLFWLCSLLTGSALPNRDLIVSNLSKMIGWEKCHLRKAWYRFYWNDHKFFHRGSDILWILQDSTFFLAQDIHTDFSGCYSGDMIHSHPFSMIPALFSPGCEYQE